MNRLSKRELEITEMIANGYSNKEIANELNRAEMTIVNTIQNIYNKLSIKRSFNSLTAWYYITKYNLEVDKKILHNNYITYVILLLLVPLTLDFSDVKRNTRITRRCYKRRIEHIV